MAAAQLLPEVGLFFTQTKIFSVYFGFGQVIECYCFLEFFDFFSCCSLNVFGSCFLYNFMERSVICCSCKNHTSDDKSQKFVSSRNLFFFCGN